MLNLYLYLIEKQFVKEKSNRKTNSIKYQLKVNIH
jgi:hypothetical protein